MGNKTEQAKKVGNTILKVAKVIVAVGTAAATIGAVTKKK